ncbi:5-hydroxytryptamine receptor 3A-like isoform X2 [Ascaphus truei]|uniref:5-hydroxytryptamine receptor 3A-like isoform X2 n=1 Tax=Ascaphus truei TaxID=8439 RepID=UPI003F5AB750
MPPLVVPLLLGVTLLGVCNSQPICNFNDLLQNLNLSDAPEMRMRPVRDWMTPSVVLIDMSLYTILSLDMRLQTITTFIWFTMAWQNEFVSWNPDEFCGIKRISVPVELFWKPDLYIYEMIEDEDKSPVIPYYLLYSNGTVVNSKPLRIVSTCNLDMFKFPFDIQTCSLSFGPYLHSVKDLIMLPKSNSSTVSALSRTVFAGKGDWTLSDISVLNTTYDSDGEKYSQVIYKITIKRTPIIYIINLIIPACFLLFLDIASMFIQMGTGERLGFKITVVLGFSVLLLILNDLLPNSDSTPVLGIFCTVCLAVMVASIIGSIAISYMLTESATQPDVPLWIKIWVLNHLARVLRFKKRSDKEELVTVVAVNKDSSDGKKVEKNLELCEKRKISQREARGSLEAKLLKRLLAEILKIHYELNLSKNEDDAKSEWYMAALVVDRLVLILYLVTVVIIFAIVIIVWAK